MARTRNPDAHAVRRDAFVDAAQVLVQQRGYEQMSIQDVLDAVGASRGAFYHYFDGKAALLDAVVERMVDDGMARTLPVVEDPGLPAPAKLRAFFATIADFKWEQRELVMAMLESWLSDDNAIVREQLRRRTFRRLSPVFSDILRQGRAEGTMLVDDSDGVGPVLAGLLLGMQDAVLDMFVEFQAGRRTPDSIEDVLLAWAASFERIAGMEPGAATLFQRGLMRQWFG